MNDILFFFIHRRSRLCDLPLCVEKQVYVILPTRFVARIWWPPNRLNILPLFVCVDNMQWDVNNVYCSSKPVFFFFLPLHISPHGIVRLSPDTLSTMAGGHCDPIGRPMFGWLREPSFPAHRGIVLLTDRLPAPHPTQEVCLHGQGVGGRAHTDDTQHLKGRKNCKNVRNMMQKHLWKWHGHNIPYILFAFLK